MQFITRTNQRCVRYLGHDFKVCVYGQHTAFSLDFFPLFQLHFLSLWFFQKQRDAMEEARLHAC